jgi:glycosyltransferase involved in cell wall biosynthesis
MNKKLCLLAVGMHVFSLGFVLGMDNTSSVGQSTSSCSMSSATTQSSALPKGKRVLIIIDADVKGHVGGIERVVNEMVSRLQERNCQTRVFDLTQIDESIISKVGTERVVSTWAWFNGTVGSCVEVEIKAFKPDHVLIALLGPISFGAVSYCYANNIPFSLFYGIRFPEMVNAMFSVPTCILRVFINRYLTKATNILVPTLSMQRELEAGGIERVVAWPLAVDLNTFTLPTQMEKEQARQRCGLQLFKGPFWLYVGHVSTAKNIQAFLDVKLPGTKILVGDGNIGYPDLGALKKQYPAIVFAGCQKGQDLIDWYHCGDVFVFPGWIDAFCLPLLEALACGMPVAAFNTVGPRDVVPMSSGVSYLAESDEKLADCALRAWDDLQAGNVTPEQCRKYAATFSWDSAAVALLNDMPQVSLSEDDEEDDRCCCGCC